MSRWFGSCTSGWTSVGICNVVSSRGNCRPDLGGFVTDLLPALSRSLAEEFNVFRVMHHGTHEKQLSNVFAWLLRPEATHGLDDTFQRIFLDRVNAGLSTEDKLPSAGYRVFQEVNTTGEAEAADGDAGRDIADILLISDDAAVAIENYGTSDGHGHDYHRYLAHAAGSGRRAVVVLLCIRRVAHLQRDGWEQAAVVTYAEVLKDLKAHIANDRVWCRRHPEQHFFLEQMFHHFVEGPTAVNLNDQLAFIKAMCDTGESERYASAQRDQAAAEFADIFAEHAQRQFEDSRNTLTEVKASLRRFALEVLRGQVNEKLDSGLIEKVEARYRGRWEWGVQLWRADDYPALYLVFGHTAVVTVQRAPEQVPSPDYLRVFVTHQAAGAESAKTSHPV